MSEITPILGTLALLSAAIVTQGLAHLTKRERSLQITTVLRAGAALLLVSALILSASKLGQWTPHDLRQASLGLALTSMTVLLALSLLGRRSLGRVTAGPVADVAIGTLSLLAIWVWPGTPHPSCMQRALTTWAEWGFYMLGLGATMLAASTGMAVLLHRWLPAHTEANQILLRQATMLALLLLGGGLIVGAIWSLRIGGSLDPALPGGDPRVGWMAITWLITAMSHLAWKSGRRPAALAAALAVLAASSGTVGLLALPDLLRLLGL